MGGSGFPLNSSGSLHRNDYSQRLGDDVMPAAAVTAATDSKIYVSESGQQAAPTASVVVVRIAWQSRASVPLLSSSLLRDYFISRQVPRAGSTFTISLLDCFQASLSVIAITPPPQEGAPSPAATEYTKFFVLPPIAPSLTARQLPSLPTSCFVHGDLLRNLVRLKLSPHLSARDDSDRLSAPSIFLVHGSYNAGKTTTISYVSSSQQATFIRLRPSDILPHVTSPSSLHLVLKYYVDAAVACAPAVLLVDDAQFIFPPEQHVAAATFVLLADSVRAASSARVALVAAVAPSLEAVHPVVRANADVVVQLAMTAQHDMAVVAMAVDDARAADATETLPNVVLPRLVLERNWSTVSLSLGGLHSPLRLLRRALLWPLTRRHTLDRLGAQTPTALLLYGPPGTGKTALVEKVSAALGYKLHLLDAAKLASGEVGASESILVSSFEKAARQKPSLIFFDEVDALFSNVEGSSTQRSRLVAKLATILDELGDGVVVIAATNKPWRIAKSLLRAGRFDHCVYVALPSREGRAAIAAIYARHMELHEMLADELLRLASGDDADGFSGADIAGACRRAVMMAMWNNRDVGVDELRSAFRESRPSVTVEQAELIGSWTASAAIG